MYKRFFKRALDFLCSGLAILCLSPVLAVIAVWVKASSPGPVLFTQKRVGKGKTFFKIYKFRTMRTDTPHDMPTHMLENPDAFITSAGRFLRRTSLDELPQIFNIFLGQMSIVGPRPALWNQDDLVAERDKGRAGLLVSLELDEVMSLSDRILVMYEGEIVGELDPAATDVQELGLYMAGAKRMKKEGEGA